MAESAGSIYYSVDIETQKTLDAQKKLDKGFNSMQSSMDKTDKAASRAEKGIDKLGKSAGSAASQSAGLTSKLTPLASAIAGIITIQTLVTLQQLGERFNLLQSRITRLSADTAEASKTYRDLLNISSKTGAAIGDTVQLWESLTGTLKELGQTNDQVLRLTATLQKIGTLGGTSANDMSNALRQLGQGLAGGVIRAEEFNSVLEGMPELARQIAKGLGIPFSELRQRMLDGKLTAEDVLSAISKRTSDVDAEFAKIPRTVAQATNAIINEFGAAIATIDKATGSSNLLAKALDAVALGIRLTSGSLTDQERLNVLFSDRVKLQGQLATIDKGFLKNSSEANRLRDELKQIEMELLAIQDRRIAQQKKESAGAGAQTVSATPPVTSEGGQKALEALRQQAALAKLTGEERAKLSAIQKLGADATAQEKAQAAELAAEIYRLTEAQRASIAVRKEGESQSKKEIADAQKLSDLREKEEQRARKDASEKMVAQQTMAGQVDPLIGGQQAFDAELERIRLLEEAGILSKQRGDELKLQLEREHLAQMQVLREEDFARQSATNELLLASLAQLQEGATNALVGLVTGASNGEEAIRSLASSILNEAVGALVKMGIEQVKSIVMGQVAQTAATATGVASAATLATAYAPAAAAASVASFGGAAAAGLSALASAIPAAIGLFAGRAQGGPVQADNMYRINETGGPEIFNAANGRQYMMPNQRGEVVSNKDATGNGGGANVVVNITNNTGQKVTQSETQMDDKRVIDIIVGDIMGDGKTSKAIQRTTGTRRVGA